MAEPVPELLSIPTEGAADGEEESLMATSGGRLITLNKGKE